MSVITWLTWLVGGAFLACALAGPIWGLLFMVVWVVVAVTWLEPK